MGETERETELRNLRTGVKTLSEWAAELLTAFADRGVACPYSGQWQEAHGRFWRAIQSTPEVVRARCDSERVYFWEAESECAKN